MLNTIVIILSSTFIFYCCLECISGFYLTNKIIERDTGYEPNDIIESDEIIFNLLSPSDSV